MAQNEHNNGMTNEGRDTIIEPDGPSVNSKEEDGSKVGTELIMEKVSKVKIKHKLFHTVHISRRM